MIFFLFRIKEILLSHEFPLGEIFNEASQKFSTQIKKKKKKISSLPNGLFRHKLMINFHWRKVNKNTNKQKHTDLHKAWQKETYHRLKFWLYKLHIPQHQINKNTIETSIKLELIPQSSYPFLYALLVEKIYKFSFNTLPNRAKFWIQLLWTPIENHWTTITRHATLANNNAENRVKDFSRPNCF